MRLLVDESTGKQLAALLQADGYDVQYVGEVSPGVSDEEVLAYAEKTGRILVTDDKDFGEFVYRTQRPRKGLIFLRLPSVRAQDRIRILKMVLSEYRIERTFLIVKEGSVRQRKIGNQDL